MVLGNSGEIYGFFGSQTEPQRVCVSCLQTEAEFNINNLTSVTSVTSRPSCSLSRLDFRVNISSQ